MKSCQKALLLLPSYCLIPLAFAREPLKHPSIPPNLQGLWAKGGHCDDPKRQLRVTAHTTQFGTKKPVSSYYLPNDNVIQYAAIVQDVNDPGSTLEDSAVTYERFQNFLFDYGGTQIKSTFILGVRHRNRADEKLSTKLVVVAFLSLSLPLLQQRSLMRETTSHCLFREADERRLGHVPLTQDQFDALVSFDYNMGAGRLGEIAKLLNTGDYQHAANALEHFSDRDRGLRKRRHAEADMFRGSR